PGLHPHPVADPHRAFAQHAGVEAAPAGVLLLRYAQEAPIDEGAGDVLAGTGVVGELKRGRADFERRAGDHHRPIDAGQGQVLADRSHCDRMPFGLQGADQLERIEAYGALRPAVVAPVALPVAAQSLRGDEGVGLRELRHAARREVDGVNCPFGHSASITARVTSCVRALPPRSGVNTFFAVTASMAFMMRDAAFASPRCSSIIDAVQKVAIGFATPLPVMSKAEPWIGSNIDGNLRSGLRFAVGAMPSEPDSAAARSERMSACRLEATTVSIAAGFSTMRVVMASTSTRSVFTSGKSFATRMKISSHSTMPWRCA